ncbi:MAG: hypothetical protein GYB68_13345, partial [Chloroflexi bacterium]|nr:hypothetical protein [Chloroflexota bacterium]
KLPPAIERHLRVDRLAVELVDQRLPEVLVQSIALPRQPGDFLGNGGQIALLLRGQIGDGQTFDELWLNSIAPVSKSDIMHSCNLGNEEPAYTALHDS